MNGRQFFKKKVSGSISRRSFLLRASLLCSAIAISGCIRKFKPGSSPYSHIKGSLKGPSARAGHILRDKVPLPQPSYTKSIKTLIIGGGISGLSAARWLKLHGDDEFELLELEDQTGGNSRFGKNEVSAYPLGAHYITLANNDNKELLHFYEECKIVTHYENNLPFYNEFMLCFDPEERLLINGQWQEGLIPDFGINEEDRRQIREFFILIETLKAAKGKDGKYAFDIPLDYSSVDNEYRYLDKISFKEYLHSKTFTSPYLLWYLEYCCKDDYGQKLNSISAWAGLHYFAGRKGNAANAESNAVLTWPEGNGYLAKHLAGSVKGHITTGALVYDISEGKDNTLIVNVYDTARKLTYSVQTEKIIMASPHYVNSKLLSSLKSPAKQAADFNYSPWLIANITIKGLAGGPGAPLSWDNVAYNTPSVGYVNANQQSVKRAEEKQVITYYLPLCDYEPRVARLAAYTRSYEQWLDIVMPELEYMHPSITDLIEEIEFWVWGHGMISPAPGFIWGKGRSDAQQPINNKIFFAHSDLSGISIFEEAFYQGVKAAKNIISSYETS